MVLHKKTSNIKSPAKNSPKNAVGKSRKRSAPTSSEESSPVKKTRGARAAVVKQDSSESEPSSPISLESESSSVKSSPRKKATSSTAASRKTLTRSKIQSESESEGNKTPVKGRKATKQLKVDQFSTKVSTRNVRRARSLANGTDEDSMEIESPQPVSASKRGRGRRK